MKGLTDLLSSIKHELICSAQDPMIESIEFDSRLCLAGSLFVAVSYTHLTLPTILLV